MDRRSTVRGLLAFKGMEETGSLSIKTDAVVGIHKGLHKREEQRARIEEEGPHSRKETWGGKREDIRKPHIAKKESE